VVLILLWLASASTSAAQPETAVSTPQSARAARSAPPLGRLFFTPIERAQLDIARVQKKAPAPATVAEPVQAPPSAPQIVRYGGIVRRSDGKSMLWINNRLVEEKEALAGLNLKGKVRPDGSVTLQVPESGSSIDVKVGQSVELHSGKLAEGRHARPAQKAVEETRPGAAQPGSIASTASATNSGEQRPDPAADSGLKMDLGRGASKSPDGERPAAK
jgi:uncharacterized caspase-like protein